ncbi:guanylate kinase [Frigoribacterium sp. CG_9.8]|jgi:guanylate kinase|uniref:guanylate kinase n=1 Tax=Frigoribacterium sp. CG_9.8 TaxID=2787733 RepID=UPI0018CB4689|nr:guanylate kinase [Frigoribacterium sp. CG_9.8]MBG6108082.1 guanylate kinase [Frigoribacterium sp. CG_9.8]
MPRVAPPEVDRVAAAHAAVAARRARASVKLAIHDRSRSAVDVVEAAWADPLATAEASLRVRELLTSIPTLGPTRTAKAMGELGIADSKRVGGLGVRQRRKLVEWLVHREHRDTPQRARLVVLAGPTAVGKGTVSTYIREHYPDVHVSVSATTRLPRVGEVHGVNYYFVSDDDFDRLIETDQMLETATVHNAFRYGTPRAPIDEALSAGKSVLLEIDLQGARSVRKVLPDALLVFLLPPTWEELVRRLIGRNTEDSAEQQRRLETAKVELAAQDEFDHRVVNSTVSTAAREVVDLMLVPKYNRSFTHG